MVFVQSSWLCKYIFRIPIYCSNIFLWMANEISICWLQIFHMMLSNKWYLLLLIMSLKIVLFGTLLQMEFILPDQRTDDSLPNGATNNSSISTPKIHSFFFFFGQILFVSIDTFLLTCFVADAAYSLKTFSTCYVIVIEQSKFGMLLTREFK